MMSDTGWIFQILEMIGRVLGWMVMGLLILAVVGTAGYGLVYIVAGCLGAWRGRRVGRQRACRRSRGVVPDMPGKPPPMPPVKKPKEPRETWHFPAGMNYSTCAKAMKVEPLSLEAVVAACQPPWEGMSLAVVITTKADFDMLTDLLPPRPVAGLRMPFSSVPFYGVPVRKYDDEGMARAAAIVAEADGYEVMLFLPDKGWEAREDTPPPVREAEDAVGQAPPYGSDKARIRRAD